jgi:Arc/MetJ-type ribon-helix-helix transcriptional regulator
MGIRLTEAQYKMIRKICRKDSEKYDNESHFVRCSVAKVIREEKRRLNL